MTEHFVNSAPTSLEAMMAHILESACGATDPDAEGWRDYYVETHCVTFRIVARKVRDGRVNASTPDGWHYPTTTLPGGWVQPDADGWQIREYGVRDS
jgi:hypothetical protein